MFFVTAPHPKCVQQEWRGMCVFWLWQTFRIDQELHELDGEYHRCAATVQTPENEWFAQAINCYQRVSLHCDTTSDEVGLALFCDSKHMLCPRLESIVSDLTFIQIVPDVLE